MVKKDFSKTGWIIYFKLVSVNLKIIINLIKLKFTLKY